jgi:hypothetical protein
MELENENLFAKIQEFLNGLNGEYKIIDRQIDIDLQMEYFEQSKTVKANADPEKILNERENLFSAGTSVAEKKRLLVELATLDNVEAFRTIEKYMEQADDELKDWGTLALNQSKMQLEGSLLEQNQVFISTGLGGRNNKLRYFIVFLLQDGLEMNSFRQKIAEGEIAFCLKKYDAEVEALHFFEKYFTAMVLNPINVPLQEVIELVVENCNQFGSFLQKNYIVTNVKELNESEITEILSTPQSSVNDITILPDNPDS